MVKVYRNIATPILFFGLELVDCVAVFVVFLGVFYVSDHMLLNLLIVACAYFSLRFIKKGKPAGYTLSLAKFLVSPEEKHVRLESRHEPG